MANAVMMGGGWTVSLRKQRTFEHFPSPAGILGRMGEKENGKLNGIIEDARKRETVHSALGDKKSGEKRKQSSLINGTNNNSARDGGRRTARSSFVTPNIRYENI